MSWAEMSKRDRHEHREQNKEIDKLHRELRGGDRDENRPARAPKAERAVVAGNAIIGDQLSYAPVGETDGGQMGRIRKTQLQKEGHSWDMNERSTKVGEVTDSLGRRRFHGAFTGGQSAGYFMSVGSKEGWTPQTFRSSRSERNKKQQSVDDFMDDEDREEEMQGGKTLTTTADFTSFAGLDGPSGRPAKISSGGAPVISSVTSAGGYGGGPEPLGWKLLKTMGWREGDSVGAQISKERKKEIKAAAVAPARAAGEKKTYGAMLPPGGLSAFHNTMKSALGGGAPKKQLATGPVFGSGDAVALLKRSIKKDFYGLGYDPHHDAPEFASAAAATQQSRMEQQERQEYNKAAGQTNKQSFGDDDEYDHVYGKESLAQYDQFVDEEPTPAMQQVPELPSRLRQAKPRDSASWLQHNFVQATQSAAERPWWAPPKVPKNFDPRHVFSDGDKGATEAHKAAVKQFQAERGRGLLNHNGRAGLLGEKQHKPNPESDVREVGQGPSQAQETKLIEAANKVIRQGKAAYNPYPEDEPKAKRYAAFVRELANLKDVEPEEQDMEQVGSLCLGGEEKEEFCKVVYMFQPRVSVLNNHFQSCDDLAVEGDVRKEQGKNPMELAAKKGAYGAATREVLEWRPAPLLCKRANVRNPYPGGVTVGTQRVEKPAGFGHLPEHMLEAIAEEMDPQSGRDKKPVKKVMQLEFEKANEPEPEIEVPEVDKPSMEMFKAIFDDSSDDEDDEDEPPQTTPHPPTGAPPEVMDISVPTTAVQSKQVKAEPPSTDMEVEESSVMGSVMGPPAPPPLSSIDIGPMPPSADHEMPIAIAPAAPPEEDPAPKIVFRKPPAKRRTKKRPTAADFMNKSGI